MDMLKHIQKNLPIHSKKRNDTCIELNYTTEKNCASISLSNGIAQIFISFL